MRLTKAIREKIRENVIKATDLPKEREAIIKEEKELVRKLVEEQISKNFKELTKNAPKEWFYFVDGAYLKTEKAEAVMNDERGRWVKFPKIPCPYNFSPSCIDNNLPTYGKALEWRKKYEKLNSELTGILRKYTSLDKLLKECPYLKPHVPEEAKKTYPIMISDANLCASLNAVGFTFEGEGK